MLRCLSSAQLTELIAYMDIEAFPGALTREEAVEKDKQDRTAILKDRMQRGLFGGKPK